MASLSVTLRHRCVCFRSHPRVPTCQSLTWGRTGCFFGGSGTGLRTGAVTGIRGRTTNELWLTLAQRFEVPNLTSLGTTAQSRGTKPRPPRLTWVTDSAEHAVERQVLETRNENARRLVRVGGRYRAHEGGLTYALAAAAFFTSWSTSSIIAAVALSPRRMPTRSTRV